MIFYYRYFILTHIKIEYFIIIKIIMFSYEEHNYNNSRWEDETKYMNIENFDCFRYAFPKSEFPEFHIYKEETNKDLLDITNKIENMDIDGMNDIINGMSNIQIDYNSYSVKDLKKICKDKGIKGYSKLKKQDLIKILSF
jgi:hypothetical protein